MLLNAFWTVLDRASRPLLEYSQTGAISGPRTINKPFSYIGYYPNGARSYSARSVGRVPFLRYGGMEFESNWWREMFIRAAGLPSTYVVPPAAEQIHSACDTTRLASRGRTSVGLPEHRLPGECSLIPQKRTATLK